MPRPRAPKMSDSVCPGCTRTTCQSSTVAGVVLTGAILGSASGSNEWTSGVGAGRIALAQAGMMKPDSRVISNAVPASTRRSRFQRIGSISPERLNDQWARCS